ncbi:hypothetical protein BDN70DRAFT_585399 [Pholiota conissans]|uniref:F-box domain-containing protein n=1 Tax=Pholiota conissans TaxID=109636 RepID=A0A9P5Z471_9AGAR|nr:hypothetical protein BDN70DRAFT_585399 [Pholiota conissans]
MSETHGLLALNCNTPTAEAHSLIDKALKRRGAPILALKSQRNAFAPISRLPPEILCKIFSNVKEKEPSSPEESFKLTHVCRHWRNVGIESSSLWTELMWQNPEVTELMFRRCKGAPLVMKTPEFPYDELSVRPRFFEALKKYFDHVHRVKELTLYLAVPQWAELRNLFPKSAAHLEHLRISLQARGSVDFVSGNLLCETPQLRHLELSCFNVDWTTHSHLLRSLTYLSLENIAFTGLTWRSFANAMKEMPDLQILSLIGAFPKTTNELVDWTPIHLASLQNLIVACHQTTIEMFLSCITFPATTKTRVKCYITDHQHEPNFSGMYTKLGQIYSKALPQKDYKTLVLMEQGYLTNGFTVKLFVDAFVEEQLLVLKPKTMSSDLEFEISWSILAAGADEIGIKALNGLFNSGLPLHNIGRVFITTPIPWVLKPETFASTIGTLTQPLSILTTGAAARFVVNALLLSIGDTSQGKPTYFPNLTSIFLHKAKFATPKMMKTDEIVQFANLHRCLAERAKRGAKLERLVFMYCTRVMKSDVDALAGFVGKLDCDSQDLHLGIDLDGGPIQPRRVLRRRVPKPEKKTSKRKKKTAT